VALRIGVIGGTGLYGLPGSEVLEIETPNGDVRMDRTRVGGRETFFIARHGHDHRWSPLQVPHEAHVHALRSARCDYVIGVNNVGGLRKELRPGAWTIAKDFLDLHAQNRRRWFGSASVHTDFSHAYCPTVRSALRAGAGSSVADVVLAGVDGPRFETPAEVRRLVAIGADVVGMTGVPEAVLAREAGLCYASLCFVGNLASGLGPSVAATKIQAGLAHNKRTLLRILDAAIRRLPSRTGCDCASATRHAVLGGA
jgi:5'-methylthioadenosine phosphorylase